jgi:hypothetical protein
MALVTGLKKWLANNSDRQLDVTLVGERRKKNALLVKGVRLLRWFHAGKPALRPLEGIAVLFESYS